MIAMVTTSSASAVMERGTTTSRTTGRLLRDRHIVKKRTRHALARVREIFRQRYKRGRRLDGFSRGVIVRIDAGGLEHLDVRDVAVAVNREADRDLSFESGAEDLRHDRVPVDADAADHRLCVRAPIEPRGLERDRSLFGESFFAALQLSQVEIVAAAERGDFHFAQ